MDAATFVTGGEPMEAIGALQGVIQLFDELEVDATTPGDLGRVRGAVDYFLHVVPQLL